MSYKSEDLHYFDVYVPGIAEVWETCLYPSLAGVVPQMALYFTCSLAFRITSQTCKSKTESHQSYALLTNLCFITQVD